MKVNPKLVAAVLAVLLAIAGVLGFQSEEFKKEFCGQGASPSPAPSTIPEAK